MGYGAPCLVFCSRGRGKGEVAAVAAAAVGRGVLQLMRPSERYRRCALFEGGGVGYACCRRVVGSLYARCMRHVCVMYARCMRDVCALNMGDI